MLGTFEQFGTSGRARTGRFHTAHGAFDTPAFMPVGTQGTVKGVSPRELSELGAQIILSNTYHLHIRPGDELIRDLGGLHKFMGWSGPILTDSGGFQVYSLARIRRVTDEGVSFQSHIDGSPIDLTPERVVRIQENLGVDIMMVLDECVSHPAERSAVESSLARTTRWARAARQARRKPSVLAFGIVQGGMYPDLRKRAVEDLCEIGFDGYAIGGLSVGEPSEVLHQTASETAAKLPPDRIRYLMGVGTPSDIVRAVDAGIDLFDCVIPTRSARFGRIFSGYGHLNIRNEQFRRDPNPIEENCACYTCKNFSRAYLSHLVHAKEVLAVQLATLHNLHYYQRLMRSIRAGVLEGSFGDLRDRFLRKAGPLCIGESGGNGESEDEPGSYREFGRGDD